MQVGKFHGALSYLRRALKLEAGGMASAAQNCRVFCHAERESMGMSAPSNVGLTEILAVGMGIEDPLQMWLSIDEPANLVPSLQDEHSENVFHFRNRESLNHYEYVPLMFGCSFAYGQPPSEHLQNLVPEGL